MDRRKVEPHKAFLRETSELTDLELNNLIDAYADFLCTSSRHEMSADLNKMVMDTLNSLVGERKRRQPLQ